MSSRSPSIDRVVAALAGLGIETHVQELPDSTRTAADAAKTIGCEVAQIAKSVVFRGKKSDSAILVVASGVNRISEGKVEAIIGEAVAKADADFVRSRTGFVIGGVPPVGHTGLSGTILDEDLKQFDVIWAAAGTPNAVFCIKPGDLFRTVGNGVNVKV